jgi:hypothetical protein
MASRQRVKLRRNAGVFSSTSLPELARQTKEAFDLLAAQNNELQSMLLQIIDGTATPKRLLPLHEKLEFAGTGVTLTSTGDRNVATITGGLTSATGLDGVDASGTTALVVRASRGRTATTLTTSQGAYNPSATADFVSIGASSPSCTIHGWQAPGANDTKFRWIVCDSTSFTWRFQHLSTSASSTADRVFLSTPDAVSDTTSLSMNAGDAVAAWYDEANQWWRILSRSDFFGGLAASGLDGVSLSVAQLNADQYRYTARASRNVITPPALTANVSGYSPTDWDTADVGLFSASGTHRAILSLAAPTANGTRLKYIANVGSTWNVSFAYLTGTSGLQIITPEQVDPFQLTPDSGIWIFYDTTGVGFWRIIAATRTLAHSELSGLTSGDPHTQYILVAGTRAFTGDQSMGGNGLTNVNNIDMVSGGGTIDNVGLLTLGPVSGEIDAAGGYISRLHRADWEDDADSGIGTPSTGYNRMGMVRGVPLIIPSGLDHASDVPIVVMTGTAAGSDVDVDVTISNIHGIDLSGGAFSVTCRGYGVPPSDATDLGHVMRSEYFYYRTDSTNTWTRVQIELNEEGKPLGSLLINPLMNSDTVLRVSVNLSALASGMRYLAEVRITGRGRGA